MGARRPVVCDPAPEAVRGDRPAGRRPGAVPGHLPGQGAGRDHLGAQRVKGHRVVEGRPKHYWSIYQKMIVKGRDFDDIHDLVGVRILCDEIRDCTPLSAWCIHCGSRSRAGSRTTSPSRVTAYTSRCTPLSSAPKASRWKYRSAPTTCTRPLNTASPHTGATRKPRAVTLYRIRYAAAEIDDMAWMRQLLDWQREAADPGEFLEALRYDLAVQEIFVFTPKGDLITLPTGSTRSTSPTRCTPSRPSLHRRQGQRQTGRTGTQA